MTFKPSLKNISLFAFIWLNIGFALGLAILLGPVRWVVNYSRKNNYSDNTESILVKGLIVAFIALSFLIAFITTSRTIHAKARNTKIIIPLICLAFGSFALLQLMTPENLKSFASRENDARNEQFVFGSYPNKEDLENFKKEGYAAVISLLDPAVAPFEPILLQEEEENCRKVGIRLISIPMLPWVSKNEEALQKIKHLAQHPSGKYYVHCYLGKDRVNLAKRLIASYNKSIKIETAANTGRSLEGITEFERGEITKISNDIYFTPYPTDEEYMGYVIGAGVQQVISLMDSTDSEQKERINAERMLLDTYHIPFKNFCIRSAKDKKELAQLKELTARLPKPLVVHRFFSNTPDDIEIVDALKK